MFIIAYLTVYCKFWQKFTPSGEPEGEGGSPEKELQDLLAQNVLFLIDCAILRKFKDHDADNAKDAQSQHTAQCNADGDSVGTAFSQIQHERYQENCKVDHDRADCEIQQAAGRMMPGT